VKGLLLTLEGIEGSGKSTQAAALAASLRSAGYPVVLTREPGGAPLAERIRDLVLSPDLGSIHPACELLLFIAARAQHVADRIRPALESGQVVICDRFTDATLAYQGGGRSVPDDLLRRLNDLSTGGITPDRTYLLDVEVGTGLERAAERPGRGRDRMEREGAAFFQAVRERYLELASDEPERILKLRGTDSRESLSRQIEDDALALLQSRVPHPPR
jgi:dTMP kinase